MVYITHTPRTCSPCGARQSKAVHFNNVTEISEAKCLAIPKDMCNIYNLLVSHLSPPVNTPLNSSNITISSQADGF